MQAAVTQGLVDSREASCNDVFLINQSDALASSHHDTLAKNQYVKKPKYSDKLFKLKLLKRGSCDAIKTNPDDNSTLKKTEVPQRQHSADSLGISTSQSVPSGNVDESSTPLSCTAAVKTQQVQESCIADHPASFEQLLSSSNRRKILEQFRQYAVKCLGSCHTWHPMVYAYIPLMLLPLIVVLGATCIVVTGMIPIVGIIPAALAIMRLIKNSKKLLSCASSQKGTIIESLRKNGYDFIRWVAMLMLVGLLIAFSVAILILSGGLLLLVIPLVSIILPIFILCFIPIALGCTFILALGIILVNTESAGRIKLQLDSLFLPALACASDRAVFEHAD